MKAAVFEKVKDPLKINNNYPDPTISNEKGQAILPKLRTRTQRIIHKPNQPEPTGSCPTRTAQHWVMGENRGRPRVLWNPDEPKSSTRNGPS